MRKKLMAAGILAAVLISVLGALASHPLTFCKTDLPGAYLEAIEQQAKGLYSKRLPLVPVCIRVDSCSGKTVFYTIHYFPFGTVGMSYHETDGYNIEKPLTGL